MTDRPIQQLAQAVLDGRVRIQSTPRYERGVAVSAEHKIIVDDPYIPVADRVEYRP